MKKQTNEPRIKREKLKTRKTRFKRRTVYVSNLM